MILLDITMLSYQRNEDDLPHIGLLEIIAISDDEHQILVHPPSGRQEELPAILQLLLQGSGTEGAAAVTIILS